MEAAASGAETSAASSVASACALYDASIDDVSIEEVAGLAGDLGASLQEALAIETSSGTHGVCAEEEVSLLDVVGGEDGVRRDTTATPSGNSACTDLQLANADKSASPPAGAAPPVHAKSARSAEEISKLHERLNGLVFSNEEDGSGEYGEKTWRHAFAMVQEAVGCGYALQMNKKSKLLKKDDESASGRRNRYNCVQIKCVHSGQPRATAKTADTYARKKTSTKKFGCNWGLSLYWGANSNAPSLGKDVCLWHTYEGSEGMEHGGGAPKVPLSRYRSAAEALKENLRGYFSFIHSAMAHERCSTYAQEDSRAMIDACVLYNTKIVATCEADVPRVLDVYVQHPTTVNLMMDTNSGESIDPSQPTAAPAGVHMASRAPVSHFAGLLRGQAVHHLVRVTPLHGEEFGHLVAIGPDGFSLCTCLRQLVYGLLCPHALKAMFDSGHRTFNGASIAPRWRDSLTPWTLEGLAAKPAMLDLDAADCPVQLPPFNPNADDTSHSGTNVKAAAYANGVSFGKDMGVLLRQFTTLDGIDRVLESTKIFFKQQLEVEKRSQRLASTTQIFTGTISQPTSRLPTGDGGPTRSSKRTRPAADGRGTVPRGRCRNGRGRGGRGGGGGGGEAGSGADSGGVPTCMPAPISAGAAGELAAPPATNGATPAPLRSLSNMDVTGGARATQPAAVASLEAVLSPIARPKGGSGKRKKSGGK